MTEGYWEVSAPQVWAISRARKGATGIWRFPNLEEARRFLDTSWAEKRANFGTPTLQFIKWDSLPKPPAPPPLPEKCYIGIILCNGRTITGVGDTDEAAIADLQENAESYFEDEEEARTKFTTIESVCGWGDSRGASYVVTNDEQEFDKFMEVD